MILSKSPDLQQCVLGDASDLKSDDVLHTLISLFYLKQHQPAEYELINLNLLLEQLIKATLRRKAKYDRLTSVSDLTKVNGLETFFIFMPLLWELCEGKTEEKDFFETYDKVRG